MIRFGAKTSPGIVYCDERVARLVDPGFHAEYARSVRNGSHGFDPIHDQIQDHLLQLNAITAHGW